MLAKDRAPWNRLQAMARAVTATRAEEGDPARPQAPRNPTITPDSALAALRDARGLIQTLEEWQIQAVIGARMADVSWAEIAAAAGVSRQAAWERWHEIAASYGTATSG